MTLARSAIDVKTIAEHGLPPVGLPIAVWGPKYDGWHSAKLTEATRFRFTPGCGYVCFPVTHWFVMPALPGVGTIDPEQP